MTQAYFNKISDKISELISSSKNEILICVAWFTNKELLGKLIDKAESGCQITIIISDHFENKRLNFKQLEDKNGKIKILSTNSGKFLHDKFAIFDNNKVIIGSYNWTYSAELYNHEYAVLSNHETLVKQFRIRFSNLERIVENYEIDKFMKISVLESESKEDEFEKLEKELFDELLKSIDLSLKAGAKINKSTIIEMLFRYGSIGTAKRLVKDGADKIQSGLQKMFEINRLDLTFENIILKAKYKILFDDDTLKKASEKLQKLGYKN